MHLENCFIVLTNQTASLNTNLHLPLSVALCVTAMLCSHPGLKLYENNTKITLGITKYLKEVNTGVCQPRLLLASVGYCLLLKKVKRASLSMLWKKTIYYNFMSLKCRCEAFIHVIKKKLIP